VKIDFESTISISKVNQNFTEAARMTEDKGIVTILKNNKPKFVLMTFKKFEQCEAEKGK
jgi:antitoxin Phd